MVIPIYVSLRWFEKKDKMLIEPYTSGFFRQNNIYHQHRTIQGDSLDKKSC